MKKERLVFLKDKERSPFFDLHIECACIKSTVNCTNILLKQMRNTKTHTRNETNEEKIEKIMETMKNYYEVFTLVYIKIFTFTII